MNHLFATQDAVDTGTLAVNVTSRAKNTPIADAQITLSYAGEPETTIEEMTTDSSGQITPIELPAPPVEYSLESTQENQPFSLYNIRIRAQGYRPLLISGIELFSSVEAIQNVTIISLVVRLKCTCNLTQNMSKNNLKKER